MDNLLDQRAERVADQSNPQEVMAALCAVTEINSEQQEMLDWVLTDWVMTVLSRPEDREGVVELHTLCHMAQSSLDESASAAGFDQRWQGYADLLEAKRLALRARATTPVFELLQEPKIMAQLAKGETRQSDFIDLLNLSAGRVSQVLALLESRGKITRERRGKESWVMLAPRVVSGNVAEAANPANPAAEPQGSTFVQPQATPANDAQFSGLGRAFLTISPGQRAAG